MIINTKKPVLFVVAGSSGAGKTSVMNEIIKHGIHDHTMQYLNIENIAKDDFGDWHDKNNRAEATVQFKKLRELHLQNGANIAMETDIASDDDIAFIKKAQNQGYYVRMFYLGTENSIININRVAKRYLAGGHEDSFSSIIKNYEDSLKHLPEALMIADESQVFDTSLEGRLKKHLFTVKNGEVMNKGASYQMVSWHTKALREAKLLIDHIPAPEKPKTRTELALEKISQSHPNEKDKVTYFDPDTVETSIELAKMSVEQVMKSMSEPAIQDRPVNADIMDKWLKHNREKQDEVTARMKKHIKL